MATRQLLTKHYSRILANWPQDLLRPETPFQSLLQARVAKIPTLTDAEATAELRNVNALYSLMDDRYSRKVCCDLICGRNTMSLFPPGAIPTFDR
jgi:hypothetical protein